MRANGSARAVHLLELLVAPTVTPQLQRLFEMVLTSTIGEIRLSQLMGAVSALAPEGARLAAEQISWVYPWQAA